MKRFLLLGLVFLVTILLINTFGCVPDKVEVDVDDIPGVVKGMRVEEWDFAYCIKQRGDESFNKREVYYYTWNEPAIGPDYVLIKEAYVILKIYGDYDGKELGSPCKYYSEVSVTPPYTIIKQE